MDWVLLIIAALGVLTYVLLSRHKCNDDAIEIEITITEDDDEPTGKHEAGRGKHEAR